MLSTATSPWVDATHELLFATTRRSSPPAADAEVTATFGVPTSPLSMSCKAMIAVQGLGLASA